MELKAPRGMVDLFGNTIEQWHTIESRAGEIYSHFGYVEIRMPILERLEVFKDAIGDETDIVEKQMYIVEGEASEKLALRPEGTASFIRAVVEHQLHQPGLHQRYFYHLPMFRHERPQKGRLRQFYQTGAEFINDPSPEADAEIIALSDHILSDLGIREYSTEINSIGCTECRPVYREKLKTFLKPKLVSLCELCQKRFERSALRILDCKNETCQTLVKDAPLILDSLCENCRKHHQGVKTRLTQIGVEFQENPRIVRGLDYYCRTAFEFSSSLLGAQSALGAGGRYDGLSERFGAKAFPGVGFALGMERIVLAMEATRGIPPLKQTPSFFFASLGEKAIDFLFPMSHSLKKSGITTEMNYDPQKGLKALLKQADRSGSPFTLVLGENELNSGKALLKDMKTGSQEELSLSNLEQELKKKRSQ